MTRRERAIERTDSLDPESTRAWLRRDWMAGAIEAYEAELAADLESEEMVQLALDAVRGLPGFYERGQRVGLGSMRAALRSVLETEA